MPDTQEKDVKDLEQRCESVKGNKHPLYDETWAEYADRNKITYTEGDENSCRNYIAKYEEWYKAESENSNSNSGSSGNGGGGGSTQGGEGNQSGEAGNQGSNNSNQQENNNNNQENETQSSENQANNNQQQEKSHSNTGKSSPTQQNTQSENYLRSETQTAPASVRNSLRHDLNRLEDDCFGDLPIMQQRIMKSYAMMAHPDAYEYKSKEKKDYSGYFSDDSAQTQTVQKLVDNIVKKMINGNSAASKYLKEFLQDKRIKVHVDNVNDQDASFDGFDDKTKELHFTFDREIFNHQKEMPNTENEDRFAVTIGHELGHAIEIANRSPRCSEQLTQHKINGREVESFCDMFGLACAASAGYNLQSYIDYCTKYESKELKARELKARELKAREQEGKLNDVHPMLSHRKRLAKMAKQAYHNNMTERTLFSEEITSIEWKEHQINYTTQQKARSDFTR